MKTICRIDENNLLEHLEDHEKDLIFGKSRKKRSVKLVHLNYRTATAAAAAARAPEVVAVVNDRLITMKAGRVCFTKWHSNKQTSFKRSDSNKASGATTATTRQHQGGAQLQQYHQPPIIYCTNQRHDHGKRTYVRAQDNEHLVNLKLQQTPKLIDDSFVFIRRYANSSQLIENSHNLVTRLEKCFYHSENSALDLCDEHNVRGVFHYNNTDYIIHPLPERFGNKSHIILETERDIFDTSWRNSSFLNENIQFEPDEEEFNAVSLELPTEDSEASSMRSTRNIGHQNQHHLHPQLPLNLRFKPRHHHPSQHHLHHSRKHHLGKRNKRYIHSASQYTSIPDVLYIETAIFVDIDLYKHMAKNFPKNTSSHLIRFVLAMINGVQLFIIIHLWVKRVNFVLKRLEILEKDPPELRRSSDIDLSI
ncbi:hypothetical protein DOY81_012213 [Sarcophaga bullata]|nr:hypothetical protein DOY81_012213 [Sarcophaga bullata]